MGKILDSGNFSDNVKLYFKDLEYCKLLSGEEQLELIQRYQNGDESVLPSILESNLRLVISVAKKYINRLLYVEFQDLIQEGNMELIKAVETYDPQKSEFSTYASYLIEKRILSFLNVSNTSLERPEYLENLILRYKKLYAKYTQKGLVMPEDSVLCEMLHITSSQLKTIREEISKTPISLDQTIGEDMTLQDTLVDETNLYEGLMKEIDDRNLLLVIKEILTPMEYYVLYHRVLSGNVISLEKLGEEFYTTSQNIARIERDALDKVKEVYLDSRRRKVIGNKLKNKYGTLTWLNVKPITPQDFLKYRYIEPHLDTLERKLYYMLYVERHDYPVHFLLHSLGVSKQDYEVLFKKLSLKIVDVFSNAKDYVDFETRSLKALKTTIFKRTLKEKSEFDFEIVETFLAMNPVEEEKRKILEHAFVLPSSTMSKSELEYKFNGILLGYESGSAMQYQEDLFRFYEMNKDAFTEEQQFVLETILLKKSTASYRLKFPDGNWLKNKKDLMNSLEKMFFGIPDFRNFDFSKEDYLVVRDTSALTIEQRNILDSYFGITPSPVSYSDSELKNAKTVALNAFLGKAKKRVLVKENYIPYLNSSLLEFDEDTLEILNLFLVENFSLKEIRKRKENKMTPMKLSNLITDSLDRIDRIRFGIVNPPSFDSSKVKEFLETSGLSENEKIIFESKYLKHLKVEEIARQVGMSSKSVFSILTRLNKSILSFSVKDVKILEEEIARELLLHPSESILDHDSSTLLSLFYGFKNLWNPNGLKLDVNELANLYKVRNIKIKFQIEKCLEDLKLKKVGLLKKDLCYMERDKLNLLLEDAHLPIREEERGLICSLFGLKGTIYKTIQEFAEETKEKVPILRRRYQDAMLKIFRYINHEISGTLSFQEDIEPNLKFFPKKDQLLFIEYYKNKKTMNEIVSDYSLSESQVTYRFMKLEYQLRGILEQRKVFKLNYDAIDQMVKNEKFSYDGDKMLMKHVFDLYFGQTSFQTKSFEEIIEMLHLPIERTTLQKRLLEFLISICKYEYGIRKQNIVTESEIQNYFYSKELNYEVLNLVLKEKHADYLDFSSITKEEICEYLKGRKGSRFPQTIRRELMAFFQIRNFELLSVQEQKKVLTVLKSLKIQDNFSLKRK